MEQIPTAEEFLDKNTNAHSGAKAHKITSSGHIHSSDIPSIMIKFAKLHVEHALKRADGYVKTHDVLITENIEDSIINCYPLTNIK